MRILLLPLVTLLAACSSGDAAPSAQTSSPQSARTSSDGGTVTSRERRLVQSERMRQAMRMGRSGTIIDPDKVWKDRGYGSASGTALRNRALYEARKAAKERGIVHTGKPRTVRQGADKK